jgi:hypothetical protein
MPYTDAPITDERVAYFGRKAEEARESARKTPIAQMRISYLAIAESYEHLAAIIAHGKGIMDSSDAFLRL